MKAARPPPPRRLSASGSRSGRSPSAARRRDPARSCPSEMWMPGIFWLATRKIEKVAILRSRCERRWRIRESPGRNRGGRPARSARCAEACLRTVFSRAAGRSGWGAPGWARAGAPCRAARGRRRRRRWSRGRRRGGGPRTPCSTAAGRGCGPPSSSCRRRTPCSGSRCRACRRPPACRWRAPADTIVMLGTLWDLWKNAQLTGR